MIELVVSSLAYAFACIMVALSLVHAVRGNPRNKNIAMCRVTAWMTFACFCAYGIGLIVGAGS